jgi:hypothetical protein
VPLQKFGSGQATRTRANEERKDGGALLCHREDVGGQGTLIHTPR